MRIRVNPWLEKETVMTITRMGAFQANPELTHSLHDFLFSHHAHHQILTGMRVRHAIPIPRRPDQVTIIEVWDSIKSHQVSVKNIPFEKLTEIRPLLASAPSGRYYELVHQTRK